MKILILLLRAAMIYLILIQVVGCDSVSSSLPPSLQIPWLRKQEASPQRQNHIPLVFIYSMPDSCSHGLPGYLTHSLRQAVHVHWRRADIIFISNFQRCPALLASISDMSAQIMRMVGRSAPFFVVDSARIESEETSAYRNASRILFSGAPVNNHLWRTSASRFFQLCDFMDYFHRKEVFHIEADNMLYGDISDELLRVLRGGRFPLAVTPLVDQKFLTASVFWISKLQYLRQFTGYLLQIALQQGEVWDEFVAFLWKHFCCKKGGLFPNSTNDGLRPYALNEMSMLSFYQTVHPDRLRLLPVIPRLETRQSDSVLTDYMIGGTYSGTELNLNIIWDSGSWGQYLGGTWTKRGRDTGFVDGSHIIANAMNQAACQPVVVCRDESIIFHLIDDLSSIEKTIPARIGVDTCYTAPVVRCKETSSELTGGSSKPPAKTKESIIWSQIWNLHVHSKQTEKFLSRVCVCSSRSNESITRISKVVALPPSASLVNQLCEIFRRMMTAFALRIVVVLIFLIAILALFLKKRSR